jgi:hypothetical protein
VANLRLTSYPEICSLEEANLAAVHSSWAAFAIAAFIAVLAVAAFFVGHVAGLAGALLVDAIVGLVAGTQIRRMSKVWTVVGLAYCLVNLPALFMRAPFGFQGLTLLAVAFAPRAAINGVRGAFAHHRLVGIQDGAGLGSAWSDS